MKFKYESRGLIVSIGRFQPSSRPLHTLPRYLQSRGGQAGKYLATPGTVHESQANDGTNRTHEWIATQGVGPSPCEEERKRASNLKRSTQKRKGKRKKKKKGVHALCPACLLAPKGFCLDRVSFCFAMSQGRPATIHFPCVRNSRNVSPLSPESVPRKR